MSKSHNQQLEEVRQDGDKMQRSIGLRDTALKALRQEVDDVLREDAEKAAGLEEVIEELERLQQSEAGKAQQLAGSQQQLQVGLLLPLRLLVHSCGSIYWVRYFTRRPAAHSSLQARSSICRWICCCL